MEAFVTKYDSQEALDPDAGDYFQFGANSRDSIAELQSELAADREYWSSGESLTLNASGAVDGAYEIVSGDLKLVVDPLRFELTSVQIGQGANLLKKAVTLACFRVGGLEESGLDVGRSFVTAQAKRLSSGAVETTLRFGCQSCAYVFVAEADSGLIDIRCRFGPLSPGLTVELPWLDDAVLSSQLKLTDQTDAATRLKTEGAIWDGAQLEEISVSLKI